MIKKSILLLAISTLKVASCFSLETQLPEKIVKIIEQPKYEHAFWAIYVKEANTQKEIYNYHGNQFVLPASTTKLFSVEALLDTYGDDFRFKTPVYLLGDLKDGKFTGVVSLVGQGDLTFGGRQKDADHIEFTKLDHIIANSVPGVILTEQDPLSAIKFFAKKIKEAGVQEIEGDVLVDDRLFETVTKRDAVLSPIFINENLIDFSIRPGELNQAAKLDVRPMISTYTIKNKLITRDVGTSLNIEIEVDASSQNITLKGDIPLDQKEVIRTYPIENPAHFAKIALIDALENEGVAVHLSKPQQLPEKSAYTDLKPLAEFVSPPLSEYGKLILKVSHNIGADLVPLLLAVKDGKRTFDEGMLLFGDFVTKKAEISKDSFVFVDAAGGNDNRLTPKAEIQLLEYIQKKPKESFQKYYDALPILGVDGSLEDFGRTTNAKGKVRAKTGTGIVVNGATKDLFLTTQALTGFIEGKNGQLYEFMIAVNNAKMPTIDDIFQIFEDLAIISALIYDFSDQ